MRRSEQSLTSEPSIADRMLYPWRSLQEESGVDQRTVAMMDGHTAMLAELLKLLVNKGVLTTDEIRETITDLIAKSIEQRAEPGFEAVPVHLLRIVENWNETGNNHGTTAS